MQEELEEAVTIRQVADWIDVKKLMTIKKWPWIKEHSFISVSGNMTMIPLWVLEKKVGGPLEPMYKIGEICDYLGMSLEQVRRLLRRTGMAIKFSKYCIRYPEAAVIILLHRRQHREKRPRLY